MNWKLALLLVGFSTSLRICKALGVFPRRFCSLLGRGTSCCRALMDDLSLDKDNLHRIMSNASFLIQGLPKPNPPEVKMEKHLQSIPPQSLFVCLPLWVPHQGSDPLPPHNERVMRTCHSGTLTCAWGIGDSVHQTKPLVTQNYNVGVPDC